VTLTYGASAANHFGQLATLLGLVALLMLFVVPTLRDWRRRLRA
jgi:F0F1-type ATP synthase membrane subunit b/b'